MIRPVGKTAHESREDSFDKLSRPFVGARSEREIDQVHFDLSPASERQEPQRMLSTAHCSNRSLPDVGGYGLEPLVEPAGPAQDVRPDFFSGSARARFDLGISASRTTSILLDGDVSLRAVDSAAHGLGVARQMRQDVTDRPTIEACWPADVRISQRRQAGEQPLVGFSASLEISDKISCIHSGIVGFRASAVGATRSRAQVGHDAGMIGWSERSAVGTDQACCQHSSTQPDEHIVDAGVVASW